MNDDALNFYKKVRDYLTVYLPKQRGASPNTVKAYREALNSFIDYTVLLGIPMEKISFDCISRDSVDNFLDWLEKDKGYCISSRNQRLAAIKSFLKYSAERGKTLMAIYLDVSAIRKKKDVKACEIEYFSEEALELILAQPDQNSRKGKRDLLFMILLYDTGARVQEILDLKLRDVFIEGKSPSVTVTGKGNKMRSIPVMKKTCEHIKTYFTIYHPSKKPDDYLFYIDRKGKRSQMSADNVGKFITRYGKKARAVSKDVPEHWYPHLFRHSRAVHLYRNGMPLALVAEWLGHSNMDTTRRFYANADTAMKQEAIEKATSEFNPLLSCEISYEWENDEELLKKLYGLK